MDDLLMVLDGLEIMAKKIDIEKEVNTLEMKELEDICNEIDFEAEISFLD